MAGIAADLLLSLLLAGASLCACSDAEHKQHGTSFVDSMGRTATWVQHEDSDSHWAKLQSLHQDAQEHLERHHQAQGSHHNSEQWRNQAQSLITLLQGVKGSKQPPKEVQPFVKFILDVLEKTTLSHSTNCTNDQLVINAAISEVSKMSNILMTTILNVQNKSDIVDKCDMGAKSCFENCESSGCCASDLATTTLAPEEVQCPNATQKYRIESSGRHPRTCDFSKPNAAEHCWNALMNGPLQNLKFKLEAMYDDYVDAKQACEKKQDATTEAETTENKDQQCMGVKQKCLLMMNDCSIKQDDLQMSLCSSGGLQGTIIDKCGAIKDVIDKNATIAELDEARRKEWETLHIIKCMFSHYDQTGTFQTKEGKGIYQTCADSIPDYKTECNLVFPQPGFQLSYGHETCPSDSTIVTYQTWTRVEKSSDYVRTVKSVSSGVNGKIFDEDGTAICQAQ